MIGISTFVGRTVQKWQIPAVTPILKILSADKYILAIMIRTRKGH
ncbi:hypothetical protein ACN9TC_13575 [Lactococcus lactis]